MSKLWLLLLANGALSFGVTPADSCRLAELHGQVQVAKDCYRNLTQSDSAFARAEGYWGLHQYDEANTDFRQAVKDQRQSAVVRVEWGNLFLQRFNAREAGALFAEAVKLDENYAPAYLGLARVAAESYSKQAEDLVKQALQRQPKYPEAHEFLAYLALEDSDERLAAEESQKALQLSPEALDALAVLAAIDYLHGKSESDSMSRLLRVNPVYGKAFETGAHFLVINRRYTEGIALYRKALALEPDLQSARSQLGINLMRLAQTAEAREQLTGAYEAHYRDAPTVNALRLLETLDDYQTLRAGQVELVLHKKEADLLRPYVQAELERAVATYARKYKMQLPGVVRLEMYPNHEDFVVRTLGLPGQGGLLGVTFGQVVAMDSPSARSPGEFHWASTLWHELSHVYVVTATKSLVPRWFTEGLSVHEEGAASPRWGDRMTPQIAEAIKEKKLLPVEAIDRGFVRPEFPEQVLVSYYQAGKMLDFIAGKWGDPAILGMIHSYASRKSTTDAIAENLHLTPADFDKQFFTWLDDRTSTTVKHLSEWRSAMKEAHALEAAGKFQQAIEKAEVAREFYPEYVGGGSAYEVIADSQSSLKNAAGAQQTLERYRDAGGNSVEMLKKAGSLEEDAHRPEQAQVTYQELAYTYPEDEDLHRRWGNLLLDNHDSAGAIREYRALLTLKPADAVDAHYRLATALHANGQDGAAKDEVITALESAPRYRPAQKLLLELTEPIEHP